MNYGREKKTVLVCEKDVLLKVAVHSSCRLVPWRGGVTEAERRGWGVVPARAYTGPASQWAGPAPRPTAPREPNGGAVSYRPLRVNRQAAPAE